jgi:hypothetical protein
MSLTPGSPDPALSVVMVEPEDPITAAVLAVLAARDRDFAGARAHLHDARTVARTRARRERQILEIAASIVDGDRARAIGLSLEHQASFPGDAGVVRRITETAAAPGATLTR